MADDQSHRPAGEPGIGHQRDDDAALAAERGDPRRRVEHFRHPRRAARPLVAHDDHVVVLEFFRRLVERRQQAGFALEHPGPAAEQIVLEAALDPGEFENGGIIRRQVAAQHPKAARRLERRAHRKDHLAVGRGRVQVGDLFGQRPSGAGHHVAVQQAGVEQFADDHLDPADPVDVEHGIGAVGPGVGQDRHHVAGQGIELVGGHHVPPEVFVAGGAGDLGGMQHHVGRAADGHGDDDRVADRIAPDDVAGAQPGLHHVRQMPDQLGRKLVEPARIVRGRRDHVQGLHAGDADEGLHGVVGEHAAAAADAGAGVARDQVPVLRVRMPGGLVGADDVEGLAGPRVRPGPDGAVGHDDRRLVVFEECGQRADRRLVAGDHGDGAGKPGGLQVLAERIVGDLAADQRIAHLGGAVADAVGRGDGVFGLDQPVLQLALGGADPAEQVIVDRPDLGLDADVALAVALGPDDADRGLVNQRRVRAHDFGHSV